MKGKSKNTVKNKNTEKLADEIGLLMAEYYIAIAHVVKKNIRQRRKVKSQGLKLWDTVSPRERYDFLQKNSHLVAESFRKMLTTKLKSEMKTKLGFTEKDFHHIIYNTPGNPDITFGGGTFPTGDDTTMYGPTVNVKEKNIELKLGVGFDVSTTGIGDDIRNNEIERYKELTEKRVEGVGAWIEVVINC